MNDSQTHSTMNMFKDADDIKSNLILTTLSFLDYYRPALAFFENVPGFLNYSLNATQADRYRVEGGLEMGGLKLLVRALIDMGFVTDVLC
jgi:DNA (cytosine-5)-methyltransferase 1